ncbi:family 31 carbohydrate-binding protein [Flammeovirga yaeyamensis]|uniref:Family 31 carbohydrate-binding protein n=1 Tax=Flammeovirga yaeyamensis TaxID=367791 RepID=A0AAX1N8R4_9BACT|nr:di-heme oxidoredictase family protein [Flammeovirga yaeyamensis]MBB3700529.1 putative lipoprotein with Yx(FWY)xxD motif/cytochrome c peroxidase [Flammeovirga yaeyamensis]NMF36850.1 family 31 carbohydrate-binding protein [Flammeovirga yaeyamensis]QWG02600.1 family 31 carbohydrate-binding protein [Flammeovirga yaeyamensis]
MKELITKFCRTSPTAKNGFRKRNRSGQFKRPFFLAALFIFISSGLTQAQDYGIEVDNGSATIYFNDQNWSGEWNYICLGSNCQSGTKVGNRWERNTSGIQVGNVYDIQLKIQDNASGQYISDIYSVTAVEKGSTPPPTPTCDDGIQNGDETGVDCGGSCTPCAVTPPPVAERKVESELASILGSASIYDDPSASNGKGIAYISAQGAGFTIQNAPSSSSIEIIYASELSGEISIFRNGVDAGNVTFSSTGSWVGTYQSASANINIEEGDTFSVIFQTGDAALNIDYINFIGQATPPEPCTGLNNPQNVFTNVTTVNETSDGALDGSVTFNFNNVNNDYDSILFFFDGDSIVAGINEGAVTFNNKMAGSYTAGVKWNNGDCSTYLGTVTIGSCTNGIQDGNEVGIDCGGVCLECETPPVPTFEDLVVSVANSPTHGEYLIAKYGNQPALALYTWDNDTNEFGSCSGGCADNWPPVMTDAKSHLILPSSLPSGVTGEFGLSGTCDGQLQLTFDGQPLYYYAGDNNENDTNGEAAGNVWWLVKEITTDTCSDGIQNGDESGIDCGGSCTPCQQPPVSGGGSCSEFGLTIIDGQGVLYFSEEAGTAIYLCVNGGCYPPDVQEDGYYKRFVQISANTDYTIKVQGSNEQEKVAQVSQCYFVPTCNDGIQNGDETGVDCGGSSCNDCPTCEDGIQNGEETGVDCGGPDCVSCDVVCNGTPNPNTTVAKQDESFEGENDGILTLSFDDVQGRDILEFSIDGGLSYPYSESDALKWITITDLAAGSYHIFVRWGNGGECPIDLGYVSILEGGPIPTCSDGILNQGEERVDCGGPCAPCEVDACGEIPLVLYPTPALPTPIEGIAPGTHGYTFDLSTDLSTISVEYGQTIGIQSDGNPDFEFFCSCNQVEFEGIKLNETNQVPTKCQSAGTFYYFFRYKKKGYMTDDPGDQYMYSSLFTTAGPRIDPNTRPTIASVGANWMRFRHPHAYDGITEAIFDAVHNADQLRYLDRYETIITDGPGNLRIDPQLTSANGTFHPHTGAPVTPVRIDILDIGDSPAPRYATTVGGVSGTTYADLGPGYNYGNMVNYEITAVAGGSGAQTYNTLQNYFIGDGFNTLGDPRLASAGKASTLMILPSLATAGYNERNYNLERDAVFTQHLITLESEDDVDDFLEGHHLFHGVIHRSEASGYNQFQVDLDEAKIGSTSCGSCHFRDGRGAEITNTPRGPRVAPPVFGIGLLQWVAGAEAGLRWDGGVATVEDQARNALIEDHGINPDTDISKEDFDQIVAYTKFLTVPTRSANSYNIPGVEEGEIAFNTVGCASCHQVTQTTRTDAPKEFRDLVIRPYTDMKIHNVYNGNFRTPALWGMGRNIDLLERNGKANLFMHDGTATSLEEAIQLHGGEASDVRAAYNNLSDADRANVIKFIKSL